MKEFIIEYFHRTVAVTTSLLIFLTMISILRVRRSTPRPILVSSVIAACLAVVQISLGGIVIVEKLHAILVTIHLGVGLSLFSMTLMPVLYAYDVIRFNPPKGSTSSAGRTDNFLKQGEESTGPGTFGNS
jgi:cytochrome c oxidase assembly protein subunit 15